MTKVLIFCAGLLLTQALPALDYIGVNNRAIRLNHATKCTELIFTNTRDICDCCLLKYSEVYKISSDKALAACQAKAMCDKAYNISSDRAVRHAYTSLKPFEIINIEKLPHAPKIPETGVLGEENVIEVLSALAEQAYIPAFMKRIITKHKHMPCISIRALGNAAKGVHTGQLFAVNINEICLEGSKPKQALWRKVYILKESKKGYSELLNLYRVKISALGQEYVPTAKTLYETKVLQKYSMARITFDDAHFKFEHNGHTKYFSLLQAARGKSVQEHLSDFGIKLANSLLSADERAQEIIKTKNMFYRLGFAMSKLHQKYATTSLRKKQKLGKTYIHGDFHAQNVFYDHDSGEVTLIDNETFSLALKKRTSGVNDIVDLYLLHTVKTVAHQFSKQLLINPQLAISDTLWHELWQELFLGYLRAYDFSSQEELHEAYDEFRAKFYDALSNSQVFDSIKNFKDQRVLKRFGPSYRRFYVKEHYLEQLFIALRKNRPLA